MPLKTNITELNLRRQVLGRKTWHFVGSDGGALVNTVFVGCGSMAEHGRRRDHSGASLYPSSEPPLHGVNDGARFSVSKAEILERRANALTLDFAVADQGLCSAWVAVSGANLNWPVALLAAEVLVATRSSGLISNRPT